MTLQKLHISLFISFLLLPLNIFSQINAQIKDELLQNIKAGPPMWMQMQIFDDLAKAPLKSITRETINQTLQQDALFLVKYKINNGLVSVEYNNRMPMPSQTAFCDLITEILTELNNYISLPNIEFVYSIDDAPGNFQNLLRSQVPPLSIVNYIAPVFASCRHIEDKNVVLIPDVHTLRAIKNKILDQVSLGNAKYPWNTKKNKAFWRGLTTGGFYRLDNYEKFPRFMLTKISNNFPEKLDAKFNQVNPDDNYIKDKLIELNCVGESISVPEHMAYKYQILIDGNTNSWPRAYWQYHCNSVVLKQNSNYIQWHNNVFKPWVHFVPFDYYCQNLIQQIEWAENHDIEVQQIVQNANNAAKQCLKYTDILLYFYTVITEYAKRQAF